MKNKVLAGGLSVLLLLGGAIAVGASKNDTRVDDSIHLDDKGSNPVTSINNKTITNHLSQKIEVETEHGQTKVKVDTDDDLAPSTNIKIISANQAADIAASSVNGTVEEIEKEVEHGQVQYKVELETSDGEALVRINAETGKIISVDQDNAKRNDSSGNDSKSADGAHHNRHSGDDDK